jgi:peptide/nickel transport system substrate-binding protein
MRRALALALLVTLGAAVWASLGSASGQKAAKTTSVTISNEQGTTWTCGFNPLDANLQAWSFGPIYEPLVFVNTLKSGETTPWLATAYAWSNNNRTLTFTIRSGVKWTDGKPFSAADVLFTFKLIKKYPALDLDAVWSVLKSVSRKGNKIVFDFKTPAVPYFYFIASKTPIVSQHIWSTIKDPVTYKDTSPVGTGAFTMSSCNPQVFKLQKNPSYWQKGLPKIDTVYYPAYTSNEPANLDLATGKAQWGSQYMPNIKALYLSKSKDNHYWFPPTINVDIFVNLKDPILKNVAVRRAMAYAIDRNRVSQIGELGYEPASNQTGIVTPTFSSWLDQTLAKKFSYNPAKAISILKAAGFKMSGGVFHTPQGKPLSFSMINIGGYSDWVASAKIVEDELAKVGIKVTAENLASTTHDNDLYTGKYQLGYDGNEAPGPAPYYELRELLYSKNSAPIGKLAASNWERYYNPAVDKLINQYGATTDSAAQHAIASKLEAAMVNDVPVIPVTESVDWYQYNTKDLTGWVTTQDKYALPSAFEHPDWGVVLLHLRPKG